MYFVGFGSCIGNKLFLIIKRNIFCNVVKLILIFCVLLFFVGLGDFFLVFLLNFYLRLFDYLLFFFFISLLVYGIIDNNFIVLVFLVFLVFFYFIRLFCLCFFLSSILVEIVWELCFVYWMYLICFSYKFF